MIQAKDSSSDTFLQKIEETRLQIRNRSNEYKNMISKQTKMLEEKLDTLSKEHRESQDVLFNFNTVCKSKNKDGDKFGSAKRDFLRQSAEKIRTNRNKQVNLNWNTKFEVLKEDMVQLEVKNIFSESDYELSPFESSLKFEDWNLITLNNNNNNNNNIRTGSDAAFSMSDTISTENTSFEMSFEEYSINNNKNNNNNNNTNNLSLLSKSSIRKKAATEVHTPLSNKNKDRTQSDNNLYYNRPMHKCYIGRKLSMCIYTPGYKPGQEMAPCGLAVHRETNRIYMVDRDKHRVVVCDVNDPGRVCSNIGDNNYSVVYSLFMKTAPSKMSLPWGIALSNGVLLVTQIGDSCVKVYSMDGTYFTQFGEEGSNKGQFRNPRGIAIDHPRIDISDDESCYSEVYVCDCANQRIQVFRAIFKYLKFDYERDFGVQKLNLPNDVKISESDVIVLDSSDFCVHIFNRKGELLKSIISNGENRQVDNPLFFTVDNSGNILISDWLNNCVKVFTKEGSEVGLLGRANMFIQPKGIDILQDGRVVIANENTTEGQINIL